MNSFEITLALLRSALWGEDTPSEKWSDGWWEEIYEISCAQGVHTIVFDAFKPGCAPQKVLLARWLVDIEGAEAKFARMEKVGQELSQALDEAGIRHAILKGGTLAKYYPRPEHRIWGDIDVYFPEADGFSRAKRMAKRMGDPEMDSDGDIHYMWKGVAIEHHRFWNHLSSRAAEGMEARLDGIDLAAEDKLLMLSSHILRHSLVGGVGLRQLVDLAVATRALNGKYDKEAFRTRLESLKLGKWGGLMAAVMKNAMGIEEEELPFTPDNTYYSAFMDLVRRDGDLGKENESFLTGLTKRAGLFLKVAPCEYFARLFSLTFGRLGRLLGIGKK